LDAAFPASHAQHISDLSSVQGSGSRSVGNFRFQHTFTELLTNSARTLFALRTLKQHGLPPEAVHTIFQAIVMAKINYASPAWWGFTSGDDRGRLEAFYRRCARVGYCNKNTTIASMCD